MAERPEVLSAAEKPDTSLRGGTVAARIWLGRDPSRGELIRWLAANRDGKYLSSLYDGYKRFGSLTAGQEAAARKIMARRDAAK